MAMHVPKTGFRTMMKEGARHFSGLDEAVLRNIVACRDIAKITTSSFGPNGMNKMIVNHLDKLFVTNDAATIIRELEVEHPAAKLIIMGSQQQEHEVGDGTNFVVIFAGRVLSKAEDLLRMGLSSSEVIEGYEMACKKALEIMPELVCHTVGDISSRDEVMMAVVPAVASKQYGNELFLAGLIVDACLSVAPTAEASFNVDYIRVCKVLGQGTLSSKFTRGMVFKRVVEGTTVRSMNAKVAVYSCEVDTTQTETKGTVLIKNAAELKAFSAGEESLLEAQIKAIADTGVTVVVAGAKIGDMALHFLDKYKIMAVRLLSKHDLRRLCMAVGATALPRMTPPTSHEMGHCDEVVVEELGDTTVTVFRQTDEASAVSTIIIRGSTDNIMDDVERVIDDGVNVFKALRKDQRCLAGAGACEIELAKRLASFADTCPGLEQYAIKAFAEALEVVPYSLAENAGVKAPEVVSRLYAAHQKGEVNTGFDNEADGPAVVDAPSRGILDLFATKYWGLKFATNSAATVLRVDQIIMAKQAGGPVAQKNPQYDEER